MSRIIVAICSTTGLGSGKTTYMKEVVFRTLPNATNIRFSDPIMKFLCDGLTCLHHKGRLDYGELKDTEILPGIRGRDFMIAAGDSLRKALRPSFYAEILIKRLQDIPADVPVVIDDLRKIPELHALVNCGAKVLFVNVLKSLAPGDEKNNDCEFGREDLQAFVRGTLTGTVGLKEVVWDGRGSFVSAKRALLRELGVDAQFGDDADE